MCIRDRGKSENAFLDDFTDEQKEQCFDRLLSTKPPAIVITRNLPIFSQLLDSAKQYGVPTVSYPHLDVYKRQILYSGRIRRNMFKNY